MCQAWSFRKETTSVWCPCHTLQLGRRGTAIRKCVSVDTFYATCNIAVCDRVGEASIHDSAARLSLRGRPRQTHRPRDPMRRAVPVVESTLLPVWLSFAFGNRITVNDAKLEIVDVTSSGSDRSHCTCIPVAAILFKRRKKNQQKF